MSQISKRQTHKRKNIHIHIHITNITSFIASHSAVDQIFTKIIFMKNIRLIRARLIVRFSDDSSRKAAAKHKHELEQTNKLNNQIYVPNYKITNSYIYVLFNDESLRWWSSSTQQPLDGNRPNTMDNVWTVAPKKKTITYICIDKIITIEQNKHEKTRTLIQKPWLLLLSTARWYPFIFITHRRVVNKMHKWCACDYSFHESDRLYIYMIKLTRWQTDWNLKKWIENNQRKNKTKLTAKIHELIVSACAMSKTKEVQQQPQPFCLLMMMMMMVIWCIMYKDIIYIYIRVCMSRLQVYFSQEKWCKMYWLRSEQKDYWCCRCTSTCDAMRCDAI